MRPVKITMEGFASFTNQTTIDLAEADLFVIEGRTGSGKSSVLDAITFCLFGRAYRYDARTIAPLLSQSCNNGVVRVDFDVDGTLYTAVRVLKRTKTSVTTKEARLEKHRADGSTVVLAASPKSVTESVEGLVGLTFDQFTSVVMLPQGAFAEFLHATPKDRADLLVDLLGVGVYREMASAARARGMAASGRIDVARAQLDDLAHATDEAIAAAETTLSGYAAADGLLDAAAGDLDKLKEAGTKAAQAHQTAKADLASIDGLARPNGVDTLSERINAANGAVRKADEERATAASAAEKIETELAGMPALDRLRAAHDLEVRFAEMAEAGKQLRDRVETCQSATDEAQAAVAEAETAVQEARSAHEALRDKHATTRLLAGLHAGDDCPTCAQALPVDPDVPDDSEVASSAEALTAAEAELARLRKAHADVAGDLAAQSARLDMARTEAKRVKGDLAEAVEWLPSSCRSGEPLVVALRDRTAAQERWDTARAAVRAADTKAAEARRAAESLTEESKAAWKALDGARDGVSRLGAPSLGREDLAADWAMLLDWAATARPGLETAERHADAAITKARSDYKDRQRKLLADLAGVGIVPADKENPAAAAARVRAEAAGTLARLRADKAKADKIAAEVADATADAEVAKTVGSLLSAKGFEQWMLDRVVRKLVKGASGRLKELSSGQFSLTLDDTGTFCVVDHANADSVRTARSLSGGETFLTSLALALALSDHVASVSATATQIGALYLDEGFGTLDPDTLDVVASAIEELGRSGKQVGVITHVAHLSERMPHRVRVTRDHDGSSVQQIAA